MKVLLRFCQIDDLASGLIHVACPDGCAEVRHGRSVDKRRRRCCRLGTTGCDVHELIEFRVQNSRKSPKNVEDKIRILSAGSSQQKDLPQATVQRLDRTAETQLAKQRKVQQAAAGVNDVAITNRILRTANRRNV